MAFPTSYNGWIAHIRNWIGADDYSDAQIGTFLDLAQTRMNVELMSFHMEAQYTKTILAPDAGNPINLSLEMADFGKIRLVSVRGTGPLDVAALNEYVEKAQDLFDTSYMPELYTIDSKKLYIWPWPAENAIVDIYYYMNVPSLSASVATNVFSLYHPDILTYAAALEAAPYMVEDERIAVWESKYMGGVLAANANVPKIKMGSTPLLRKITGLS
jgi:hypothetical protein